MGFLSAGLVFTTSAVNTLVYSPRGEQEASAAGFILLSMVAVRHHFYSPVYHTDPAVRLFGYFILDRLLQLVIAATLTRLPYIKNHVDLRGTVGILVITNMETVGRKLHYPETLNLRRLCIHQHS